MESLPSTILDSLPTELVEEARQWWKSLAIDDRNELLTLCDARKELFLFETFSVGDDKPRVTGGKFLPHDDSFGISEWGEDYFQYLLDHPELMIVFEPEHRKFYIGYSRHIEARRCFVDGRVNASFQCPFQSEHCRMQVMLNGRASLALRPIATQHTAQE